MTYSQIISIFKNYKQRDKEFYRLNILIVCDLKLKPYSFLVLTLIKFKYKFNLS